MKKFLPYILIFLIISLLGCAALRREKAGGEYLKAQNHGMAVKEYQAIEELKKALEINPGQPLARKSLSLAQKESSGVVSAAEGHSGDRQIPYVSISQGTTSGVVDPLEIVIESEKEWQKLWERHAPPGSSAPSVDFATQVVVGIFAGERPTAGYQVQIVNVELERTRINVTYEVKTPQKDALVAQILTQPFHLIRLPRLNLPIQFKRSHEH